MESRDEQVAILEVLYRESGNVTYVWEALADLGPEEPLPRWIRAYLAEVAVAVAGMVHDRQASPERAVERLPGALRFVKPGRNGNAFGARRQSEDDALLAWRYGRARAAKRLGSTNELKAVIADVLKPKDPADAGDVRDISFVERRIARGRKILKAQETAKKKG